MSSNETAPTNYLNADYGVRSWLFTVDHKRIAILYLIAVTFFFALGGLMEDVLAVDVLAGGVVRTDHPRGDHEHRRRGRAHADGEARDDVRRMPRL